MHAQLPSHVRIFVTPWTVAFQAPLSMGLSRQEYWSEFPLPPPGVSSKSRDQTCATVAPTSVGRFFTHEPPGKPIKQLYSNKIKNKQLEVTEAPAI